MFACTKPVSSSPFTFRVEHDLEQKGGQLQFISFVFKVDFWEHNYIFKKKSLYNKILVKGSTRI